MRKFVLLVALVTIAAVAGCAGVARSPREIRNIAKQSLDMDMRQMVDDLNMLWLADRQYRLTKWHTR